MRTTRNRRGRGHDAAGAVMRRGAGRGTSVAPRVLAFFAMTLLLVGCAQPGFRGAGPDWLLGDPPEAYPRSGSTPPPALNDDGDDDEPTP